MILVDTSVWIDHLRKSDKQLAVLLGRSQVIMHPMIIGELACGNLQNRIQLLSLWCNLPSLGEATQSEALYFLEQNQLMGKGIGWVDLHLLASVALSGETLLWTRDKRLADLAAGMELAASGLLHKV